MTQRPVDSRVGQYCDTCGQVDTHPRHHVSDPARVNAHHFDCGRDAGCPDCVEALANAPKNARHGDALVAHLTKGMN